jgi:hypothetical protein
MLERRLFEAWQSSEARRYATLFLFLSLVLRWGIAFDAPKMQFGCHIVNRGISSVFAPYDELRSDRFVGNRNEMGDTNVRQRQICLVDLKRGLKHANRTLLVPAGVHSWPAEEPATAKKAGLMAMLFSVPVPGP